MYTRAVYVLGAVFRESMSMRICVFVLVGTHLRACPWSSSVCKLCFTTAVVQDLTDACGAKPRRFYRKVSQSGETNTQTKSPASGLEPRW